ncbi:MAG: glutaredoxin 3 [Candidatus Omnitrophota bacterium]
MEPKVKIYTTQYCPYCRKAKDLLARKGIRFADYDLTNDEEKKEEMMEKTGWTTVPIIFIGEEFIGGADDLFALENSGQLDEKLRKI